MGVLVVIGAGGMGLAIARRLGSGKTVVLADFDAATLAAAASSLTGEGHDVQPRRVDIADPGSVNALATHAAALGPVAQLAHTAGLSPSQGDARRILAVDLVGVALVLDAFGAVVAPGGAGVVVASMAGHFLPALTSEQQRQLAHTPAADLPSLDFVAAATEPGHAYSIAKHANLIRVQTASIQWGRRKARLNSISPGIVSTPMGQQELASPLGDGMRTMLAASPSARIGTPDDIATAADFLLGPDSSFITGTDLLVDGGAVAVSRRAG